MNSIKTYVEGKSLKVFFIISYQGKRFQVYTGITSTVKFSGMIFPKSVPNARAKTAMLARLFASVEEYIYMNGELPTARMKDEIKAIINGRAASVEKNILYYIDEFIKTKAKDSTKEIFLTWGCTWLISFCSCSLASPGAVITTVLTPVSCTMRPASHMPPSTGYLPAIGDL